MDKNKILKAAQLAKDDEGKRNTILKSQSIIFGFYRAFYNQVSQLDPAN
ncbi:hypothetical protein [Pediococcus parvulus]|nr:hypothetical protein [Pediococcus parvulus]